MRLRLRRLGLAAELLLSRNRDQSSREGWRTLEAASLFHGEAGLDRTGAVIALLADWELEDDYRKSKSRKPGTYGSIERLLETLQSRGGLRVFLVARCGWNARATDQEGED